MSSSSVSRHPRVIFIGNIPFEITEEQLIDIFKEVGPVLSFRLMFDRETGRSRGYAFCEYSDPETAASAIRNLSGYEIGGRHLKVDKADNDMLPSVAGGSVLGSGSGFGGGSSGGGKEQQRSSSSYDNQSSQIPLPNIRPIQNILNIPSTASTTAIHSILTSPPFTNPQTLLDLLTSLKTTIQNNPEQARHLLAGNPALSYALLQSFISLNLIDMSTVQSLLTQSQQAIQQPQSQSQPQNSSSPPPPPPSSSSQSSVEHQKAFIMQIMSMTPEQINLLPPQQRDQVLQLKQQILLQQQQQIQQIQQQQMQK